jgi:sulfatase maturation enzyme AslB (radical SAM superfamily)
LLRKSEDIAKFFEEKKKEIQKNVESIPEVVSQIIEGEKQQLIKNPEQNEQSLELINKIQEILKNNDLIEIKINLFEFEGKDLVLPNKEVMKQVSIGERLVVCDSDRKIYGLGVKDIVYDTISEKDKCIKEITFEKLN